MKSRYSSKKVTDQKAINISFNFNLLNTLLTVLQIPLGSLSQSFQIVLNQILIYPQSEIYQYQNHYYNFVGNTPATAGFLSSC